MDAANVDHPQVRERVRWGKREGEGEEERRERERERERVLIVTPSDELSAADSQSRRG